MNDLAAINDRIALWEGKARYCRTLDTKDWAGYADLFTEDCVLDVTEGTQIPIISGRDAAIRQIQSSILTAKTAHQVHSPEIALHGDEAHVVWAMQDRVIWGADRPSLKLTRLHIDVHPPS